MAIALLLMLALIGAFIGNSIPNNFEQAVPRFSVVSLFFF
jgi:hypothetical protein